MVDSIRQAIIIGAVLLNVLSVTSCDNTPLKRIRVVFDIDIPRSDIEIIRYKDHWAPNGDGDFYAEFTVVRNIDAIKQEFIDSGALPITPETIDRLVIPYGIKTTKEGYYLLPHQVSNNVFGALIMDTENNIILAYYSINGFW